MTENVVYLSQSFYYHLFSILTARGVPRGFKVLKIGKITHFQSNVAAVLIEIGRKTKRHVKGNTPGGKMKKIKFLCDAFFASIMRHKVQKMRFLKRVYFDFALFWILLPIYM